MIERLIDEIRGRLDALEWDVGELGDLLSNLSFPNRTDQTMTFDAEGLPPGHILRQAHEGTLPDGHPGYESLRRVVEGVTHIEASPPAPPASPYVPPALSTMVFDLPPAVADGLTRIEALLTTLLAEQREAAAYLARWEAIRVAEGSVTGGFAYGSRRRFAARAVEPGDGEAPADQLLDADEQAAARELDTENVTE